jgi:hypothetical protein
MYNGKHDLALTIDKLFITNTLFDNSICKNQLIFPEKVSICHTIEAFTLFTLKVHFALEMLSSIIFL